jgi:hypothetical protein
LGGSYPSLARLTDISARIAIRASNAGTGLSFYTYGWEDPRGK